MKFGELQSGEWFIASDGTNKPGIYIKIFGHNLQTSFNEGNYGHAILLKEGLICFFHEEEEIQRFQKEIRLIPE